MLQFRVPLCRIGSNVAHKVRRYKNGCSVGVYLRRWSELVSDVERFVPDRVHVARTNNNQVRLRRISAFLTLSSLKGTKRRLFMNRNDQILVLDCKTRPSCTLLTFPRPQCGKRRRDMSTLNAYQYIEQQRKKKG